MLRYRPETGGRAGLATARAGREHKVDGHGGLLIKVKGYGGAMTAVMVKGYGGAMTTIHIWP